MFLYLRQQNPSLKVVFGSIHTVRKERLKMKRSLGKMSKRSRLLRRRVSEPRLGITKLVKTFSMGDRVIIDHKTSYFGGMPHPRYRGKLGTVIGKRGEAYIIEVKVYSALKKLIVPAVHLEKA